MSEAVGPIWAAGTQVFSSSGYAVLYLPDLHNDELQREGKQPVYWWLPNAVRLARQNGDTGDYKFSFTHFRGIRSASTTVGETGSDTEVSGGLLSFSTSSAPPASVLKDTQDQLLNRFRGNDDKFWGWRTPVAPMFRPAPIMSNTTSVSNLAPGPGGGVPTAAPSKSAPGAPRTITLSRGAPPIVSSPRTVPYNARMRGSNLDMWAYYLQGQGPGSVSPFAENAYAGLVGSMPAMLIWSSFHGGTGAITVWQNLGMKVWTPQIHLHLEGDWDRIQDHFSMAAHTSFWLCSADLQAAFNDLRASGGITVVCEVDASIPGADKLQEAVDKRSDLVYQKFQEVAQKMIFDPAPFNEEAAKASGGGIFQVAFKVRHDHTHAHLSYDEKKELAYLQPYPISSTLEGLAAEIQRDPSAEKRYFHLIDVGDWDRKVARVVKPVVNWPDAAKQWVGEPVAFLSVQVGYPDAGGSLNWDGHIFQPSDPAGAVWQTQTAKKDTSEVTNPPANWTPDKTFVKRQIHFTEPPNETEYPYARVSIEKNIVDLDLGPNGVPSNDINLEVRVDNVGALNVGPMFLDADLTDASQSVEVTFQAAGNQDNGNARVPVKFLWQYANKDEPRYWMIFTGQPGFVPKFQYQVKVIVKGTIFKHGMEWTGPWADAGGNGPLTITVPAPDDPGVKMRSLAPGAVTTPVVTPPPPVVSAVVPPPPTTGGQPVVPPPAVVSASKGARIPARAMVETANVAGWSIDPEIANPSPTYRETLTARGYPTADVSSADRGTPGDGGKTGTIWEGWTVESGPNGNP